MKSISKLVILVSLLVVVGAGVYIFTQDRGNELIGGQTDNHDCLQAAGYSWCESKSKCLRVFEEFCPDAVESIVQDLNNATGNDLKLKGNKPFTWIVGENDITTSVLIDGISYETTLPGVEDYLKIEDYMKSQYEINPNANVDNSVGAARAYFVDYMACSLNYRYPFASGSTVESMQPQGKEIVTFIDCGYFNKNDIPRLVANKVISEIILTKYNLEKNEASVEITKFQENYAAGKISFFADEKVGGGQFLARKVNEKWEISYDGNGSIDCEDLKVNQGYPDEILNPEYCN